MRKATKQATKRSKVLRSAKKLEAQKPLSTGSTISEIHITKPTDISAS